MKNLNYLMHHFHASDIQSYFEYILKKHERNSVNPSIRIYSNKIKK